MNESTETLIEKAKAGDEAAWNEICRRFTPLVKKTAGHNHLAALREDATAEAWLALAEAVKRYRIASGVPAAGYLAVAVRYRIWNRFKSERRHWEHEVMTDEMPEKLRAGVEEEAEQAWLQEQVAKAVESLPKKQQLVVVVVFGRGGTLTEAADLLAVTPQAASQLQKRALARLKNALAGMYMGERG